MRCVVQRCSSASVQVEGKTVGQIGRGLLVLAGFTPDDDTRVIERIAQKLVNLRLFEDDDGRMNRSVLDIAGAILCVSQFTLYADLRRGNRPSFDAASPAAVAEPLYRHFCDAIRRHGVPCDEGTFGAEMQVSLVNDGPVTIVLDSADLDRSRRA